MDRFIATYKGKADDDLMLCYERGVAYQIDRSFIVSYDDEYYNKCLSYEDQAIALAINKGRIELVAEHYGAGPVLDVGIGSGEFVKKRPNTYGNDINPVAIEWLKRNDLWGRLDEFSAFTFWDVLEHIETPEDYLKHIPLHGFLFTSLPIFAHLDDIKFSRHYRPGEHLQYFTDLGFQAWMAQHGFILLERQNFETQAGRESILSYAFKKVMRT